MIKTHFVKIYVFVARNKIILKIFALNLSRLVTKVSGVIFSFYLKIVLNLVFSY